MEKRKWLWKRKSSERNSGETESSGSISSHLERYSDDQEAFNASSPNNSTKSPEVSSKALAISEDVNDSIRILTEKLSAALANISAKEDLVNQHSKVAEEAIAGWETAENEVVVIKQKFEDAVQQNSALEDKVSHLDGALKECVRQLRQAREGQEQKIYEAVAKTNQSWETTKFELENQLLELQNKAQSVKSEPPLHFGPDLWHEIEALKKENSVLKLELSSRLEELEIRMIERDLSIQAAETASKQHLESIKKVAKLDAECRRLKAIRSKSSFVNGHKSPDASIYVESLTDGQSESGERLNVVDIDTRTMSEETNKREPSCSDSWASALIAELDQFRIGKVVNRPLPGSSIEIDLMDDFLEMEQLAALPKTKSENQCLEPKAIVKQSKDGDSSLKVELEAMIHRMKELEEKLEKIEVEKAELEIALVRSQESLESNSSLKVEVEAMIHRTAELEEELEKREVENAELEIALAKSQERFESEANVKQSNDGDSSLKIELETMIHRTMELEEKLEKIEVEKAEVEIALAKSQESLQLKATVKQSDDGDSLSKVDIEAMIHRTTELEEKLEKIEVDKYELEIALAKSQESLEASEQQLKNTKLKLKELHRDLCMANEAKQHLESQLRIMETDAETMSAKIDALGAELEKEKALSMQISVNANESKQEARMKSAKIDSLNKEVENEKAFSAQITVKCRELEEELSRKRQEAEFQQTANSNVEVKIKQEDLAVAAGKLVECQRTIASLGQQLKSLATLEDFLIDTTSIPEFARGGSPTPKSDEPWQLHSNETYSTRVSSDHSGIPINKNDANTPPSSEKNRNGFADFFTRSKNGIQLEI